MAHLFTFDLYHDAICDSLVYWECITQKGLDLSVRGLKLLKPINFFDFGPIIQIFEIDDWRAIVRLKKCCHIYECWMSNSFFSTKIYYVISLVIRKKIFYASSYFCSVSILPFIAISCSFLETYVIFSGICQLFFEFLVCLKVALDFFFFLSPIFLAL